MAKVRQYELEDESTKQAHLFYTGFTWAEIVEISKTLFKCRKVNARVVSAGDDDEFFDYPNYGGLPKSIYKKFSSWQVDLLVEEEPKTPMQVATILARGK